MTDTITSLIEKLEGVTEGLRELDWLIADATGHPSFARKIEGIWPPFMERSRLDKDVPAYSTSLDAVLALAERVLPGWTWEITIDGCGSVQGAPEMWPEGLAAPDRDGVYVSAQTPALALCAAILRAQSEARV